MDVDVDVLVAGAVVVDASVSVVVPVVVTDEDVVVLLKGDHNDISNNISLTHIFSAHIHVHDVGSKDDVRDDVCFS